MPVRLTELEFLKRVKTIFPNIIVISKYVTNKSFIYIKDENGIKYRTKPQELMCGCIPTIISALDKNKAFEIKARKVHGDKYFYKKVNYIKSRIPIIITCSKHGDFTQTPTNHQQGKGCPLCYKRQHWGRSGWIKFCRNKFATLYFIKCFSNNEEFVKIGITSNNIKRRYYGRKAMPYNYEILREIVGDAGYIYDLEIKYQKILKTYRYSPLIYFGGSTTECFNTNCINLLTTLSY